MKQPLLLDFSIIAGVILSIIRAYLADVKTWNQKKKSLRLKLEFSKNRKNHSLLQIAQFNMNKYYERNLRQVRDIFWLTVFVMFLGFLMILAGVSPSNLIPSRDNTFPAILATTAGLITDSQQRFSLFTDQLCKQASISQQVGKNKCCWSSYADS